jgi:hypothetical protein
MALVHQEKEALLIGCRARNGAVRDDGPRTEARDDIQPVAPEKLRSARSKVMGVDALRKAARFTRPNSSGERDRAAFVAENQDTPDTHFNRLPPS